MPIILINNILGLMLCLLRSKNLFVVIFLLLMLMRNGLGKIIWSILLWVKLQKIMNAKTLQIHEIVEEDLMLMNDLEGIDK